MLLPKPLSPWKPQCLNPISILLKHPAGRSNRLHFPQQGPVYWQSSCRVLLLTLDSNLTQAKCPTIIDTEGTPARPCVVQEAGSHGGAGVWSDQGGSWDSAFYAAGAGGLCPGMDIDLRNAQSPEVVAKWKGDFVSGGLVELSGWG